MEIEPNPHSPRIRIFMVRCLHDNEVSNAATLLEGEFASAVILIVGKEFHSLSRVKLEKETRLRPM